MGSLILPTPIKHNQRHYVNEAYVLPSDEEEAKRLQLQHVLLRAAFDDRIVLAPLQLASGAEVLDIGAGTGVWALDFAATYPNAEKGHNTLHRHRQDAVEWENRFSFVHQRMLLLGLKHEQWDEVIRKIYTITAPGGWAQLFEWNFLSHCGDCGPFTARLIEVFKAYEKASGMDFLCTLRLEELMKKAGFRDVQLTVRETLLGASYGEMGEKFAEDIICAFRAFKSSIFRLGGFGLLHNEQDYDDLMDEVELEWNNPGSKMAHLRPFAGWSRPCQVGLAVVIQYIDTQLQAPMFRLYRTSTLPLHSWTRVISTRAMSTKRAMSPPRMLPCSGFTQISLSEKIEEETYPWYSPSVFYPLRLGDLLESRYQALSKLGHGSSATVWLCRDLVEHRYVALKLCISEYPSIGREREALARLNSSRVDSHVVQRCFDSFTVKSALGKVHQCFVLEPLSLNLAQCGLLFANKKWDSALFRRVTREALQAVNVVHTQAKLIHCDLRQENFLMRMPDKESVWKEAEQRELTDPCARKQVGDRVIYATPPPVVPKTFEYAVLCDFGEARPGEKTHREDIQPFAFRAPEVILEIPFSYPADIWNMGVMLWDMFEGKQLFHPYTQKTQRESNVAHLRELTAILGPPPPEMLRRSRQYGLIRRSFFDEDGGWVGDVPVPQMSLETEETRLEGREKAEFLRFMRRCLQWDPDKRATAAELCEDPWLAAS
ncbi:hypothetical protein D9619_001284 [Psilocybe cf. subviscida]|uniref:Protein kinase domain-containing protein n=1 Tax=Psilocybe cf. subviscida TaxID=2480587 RepID=A0A8H5F3P2_9AGAR|nr:hypothetical protein D9619_001284 [Psilocybe cf. subviscida]